jgi:hypothetical protein
VKTLTISFALHMALVLLVGCTVRKPITVNPVADQQLSEAREFVLAVEDKMPLWDADKIAPYEKVQIAIVKADIAMAKASDSRDELLQWTTKLHRDWDELVALDESLKRNDLT